MADTIETRVARGVALLDRELPGWVDRIDLDKLDLESDCNCVLGQEFSDRPTTPYAGPYTSGIWTLGLSGWQGSDHGFDLTAEEEAVEEAVPAAYEALTAEWKRVILARREGSAQ